MKKPTNTNSVWTPATPTPDFVAKHPHADFERWQKLTARVINAANENGWTKAEVSRRCGVPEATFSQWTNGNYGGVLANQNTLISNWLEELERSNSLAASLPVAPKFVQTPTGLDIYQALLFCQISGELVRITLPSGSGKTATAEHFRSIRPHAHLITASPHTRTTHATLADLAEELNVVEHNSTKLVRAIGRKLQRKGEGSILIVDEAQNLVPEAVDQLRHFVDVYKCGVALVGNEFTAHTYFGDRDTKSRLSVNSRTQVARRFALQLAQERDPEQGALMLIRAWGVEDEDCITYLRVLAAKEGALGNVSATIKSALLAALGAGEDLSLKHLRRAWTNRGQGGEA